MCTLALVITLCCVQVGVNDSRVQVSVDDSRERVSVDDSRVQVSVDDSRVQELLMRMTGMDLDRVFSSRKEPLTLPRYKLMDAEQLKKVVLPSLVPRPSATTPRRKIRERKKEGGLGFPFFPL